MTLTDEQKRRLYITGNYRFKAPPVCIAQWTQGSWIRFITAYNGWIIPADGDFTLPEGVE